MDPKETKFINSQRLSVHTTVNLQLCGEQTSTGHHGQYGQNSNPGPRKPITLYTGPKETKACHS